MWLNKQSQSSAPSESTLNVPANSSSPTGTTAHASRLSPTIRVKGEISGDEGLLVEGRVEGPISVGEHGLTVGQHGHVTGGLTAREIIIHGKVDGDHKVLSESIEIKKGASVIGSVKTRRIMIEDGAHFKGSIEIEEQRKEVEANPDQSAVRTLSRSA